MKLTNLPAELIGEIADLLNKHDKRDLFAFRSVCQQLRDQSAFVFGPYFSSVKVELCMCKPSLRRLQHLSQEDTIRHYIRQLVFYQPPLTHYYYPDKIPPPQTNSAFPYDDDDDDAATVVLHDLAAIFSQLPNLSRLIIRDDGFPCPFSPGTPHSQADYMLLSSHRRRLCLDVTSTLPYFILSVLTQSNTHLPSFHMYSRRNIELNVNVNPTLPFDGNPFPNMHLLPRNWATHLIDLSLDWNPQQYSSITPFAELIAHHSPALLSLRLSRFPTEFFRAVLLLLQQQSKSGRRPPNRLPKLQRLELVYCLLGSSLREQRNLNREDLTGFVAQFYETLQHFHISGLRLAASAAAAAEDGPRYYQQGYLDGPATAWRDILAQWAAGMTRLNSLGLTWLLRQVGKGGCSLSRVVVFHNLFSSWKEGVPTGVLGVNIATDRPTYGVRYYGEGEDEHGNGARAILTRMAEHARDCEVTATMNPDKISHFLGPNLPVDGNLVAGRLRIKAETADHVHCPDILGEKQPEVPYAWLRASATDETERRKRMRRVRGDREI